MKRTIKGSESESLEARCYRLEVEYQKLERGYNNLEKEYFKINKALEIVKEKLYSKEVWKNLIQDWFNYGSITQEEYDLLKEELL